jgi:hypothetical protein
MKHWARKAEIYMKHWARKAEIYMKKFRHNTKLILLRVITDRYFCHFIIPPPPGCRVGPQQRKLFVRVFI